MTAGSDRRHRSQGHSEITFFTTPKEWRNSVVSNYSKNRIIKSKSGKDSIPSHDYIMSKLQNTIRRNAMKSHGSSIKVPNIDVKELPDMHVAYVRHIGLYMGDDALFKKLFSQIFKWAEGNVGKVDFKEDTRLDWTIKKRKKWYFNNFFAIKVLIMGQNLNKIETLYDSFAKEYAEAFSGELEKKPKDREILHRFSQEIGDRRPVWDFGCGPGQTTKYLNDLGIKVFGLDLSEKILRQARLIHPRIYFEKGNILELEFQNNSIAGILAFYAIVHFTKEQLGIAFREIFRVLQPGGLFLFTYHIGDKTIHLDEFLSKKADIEFMFFTNDFIYNYLKDSGFKKIEIIEREPYPGVEYQSRRAYVFASKPAKA
jgi:SAM-dependent methyltransferase